jgi:preprotein translocase subunit SecE
MVVAEARKMDKGDDVSSGPPAWMSGPIGWAPRKFAELRTFFSEVKGELKKVTWPGRQEVYSTTIVVILTTVFFGFYLFLTDLTFSRVLSIILK